MKNIRKYLPFFLTAFIILSAYTWAQVQSTKRPIITLFIHGSKPQIPDVLYQIGQYFFLPDIHHVDEQHSYAGPHVIIQGLIDSEYVDQEHLYFFGWSGKIDAKERREVARTILLPQLEELVCQYQTKYGVTPKLHIITHSHGGNVSLNLLHELDLKKSHIIIDELILLATPIQSWTKEYVNCKSCKKIYNFYSADDWTQVIDPQGLQVHINKDTVVDKPELFEQSKRTFDHHENVTQIQVIINQKDPWHITFIDLVYPYQLRKLFPHHFPRFLPELGDIMDTIKATTIQNHIQKTKKPIVLKIDTHKTKENNRIAVYLQD